jgi:hypothetical protein
VSEPLAAIVHKALAREPAERYDTVGALIDDLEAMQEGHTISALHECGIVRAGRWYMARSPRTARLRNVDVDLLCGSSLVFGAAVAGLAAALGIPWAPRLWWLYALVAVGLAIGPLYTLLRRERPDDPGALLALSEGGATSHASVSSKDPASRGVGARPPTPGARPPTPGARPPTPDETAPTRAAPGGDPGKSPDEAGEPR